MTSVQTFEHASEALKYVLNMLTISGKSFLKVNGEGILYGVTTSEAASMILYQAINRSDMKDDPHATSDISIVKVGSKYAVRIGLAAYVKLNPTASTGSTNTDARSATPSTPQTVQSGGAPAPKRLALSRGPQRVLPGIDFQNLVAQASAPYNVNSVDEDFLAAYGYKRVPIGGDGNCLFRAIAYIVYGDQEAWPLVKKDLATSFLKYRPKKEYVRSANEVFEQRGILESIYGDDLDETLGVLTNPGEWGREQDFRFAMILYGLENTLGSANGERQRAQEHSQRSILMFNRNGRSEASHGFWDGNAYKNGTPVALSDVGHLLELITPTDLLTGGGAKTPDYIVVNLGYDSRAGTPGTHFEVIEKTNHGLPREGLLPTDFYDDHLRVSHGNAYVPDLANAYAPR